ncbi:DUF2235 domain-containing protein [Methylocystis sp. SC2]|uniref:DUF2235 domain-containing protein n=1 Tax=Methylocystis sp. (strain SC2) TaxID=187303 RepID=UPI00027AF31D|nr:DUF2235 domain-containing protein [Methylocystis sp. SC2]CCJ08385.1 Conserved hypothetical protein [Methylocystis sp. SC2]
MPKKLVIFCDGTWNELIERGTNVLRTLQAFESADSDGNPQLVHYIAGVGTRRGEKFKGGTFGYGISNNIKDAYSFLVSNYDENDEIYLFGFSRGAYTARSIAGLVHNLGILKRCNMPRVSIAYDHYKDRKSEGWKPKGADAIKFRAEHCHPWPVRIRFLGVWDTVGALGAPYGEFLGYLVDKLFGCSFHDVELSESVESAYHALAADERRWPFRPAPVKLTDYHLQRNERNISEHGFPLYKQKWFPGVHSNVGGGYSRYGLSDGALEWMAECARRNELNIAPLATARFSADRTFKKDYSQPIERSQKLYYQLLTAAFVKAPSLFGIRSVYPRCDHPLVEHVTWSGEYIRPIGPDEDIEAVQEKRKIDPAYDKMWRDLEAARNRRPLISTAVQSNCSSSAASRDNL